MAIKKYVLSPEEQLTEDQILMVGRSDSYGPRSGKTSFSCR